MSLFLLFGTILTLTGIGTLFNLHIPQNIMEKIKFIRLDHDPLNNDKLYWMGNPNGLFTIKSVLHIPKQPPPNPFHHSLIWKQNIPNKIKFFLWLCAHHRLPTNPYLHHFGIVPESICTFYKQEDETISHQPYISPHTHLLNSLKDLKLLQHSNLSNWSDFSLSSFGVYGKIETIIFSTTKTHPYRLPW